MPSSRPGVMAACLVAGLLTCATAHAQQPTYVSELVPRGYRVMLDSMDPLSALDDNANIVVLAVDDQLTLQLRTSFDQQTILRLPGPGRVLDQDLNPRLDVRTFGAGAVASDSTREGGLMLDGVPVNTENSGSFIEYQLTRPEVRRLVALYKDFWLASEGPRALWDAMGRDQFLCDRPDFWDVVEGENCSGAALVGADISAVPVGRLEDGPVWLTPQGFRVEASNITRTPRLDLFPLHPDGRPLLQLAISVDQVRSASTLPVQPSLAPVPPAPAPPEEKPNYTLIIILIAAPLLLGVGMLLSRLGGQRKRPRVKVTTIDGPALPPSQPRPRPAGPTNLNSMSMSVGAEAQSVDTLETPAYGKGVNNGPDPFVTPDDDPDSTGRPVVEYVLGTFSEDDDLGLPPEDDTGEFAHAGEGSSPAPGLQTADTVEDELPENAPTISSYADMRMSRPRVPPPEPEPLFHIDTATAVAAIDRHDSPRDVAEEEGLVVHSRTTAPAPEPESELELAEQQETILDEDLQHRDDAS